MLNIILLLCDSESWYWRVQHGCSNIIILCNLLCHGKVWKWHSIPYQFKSSCWTEWLASRIKVCYVITLFILYYAHKNFGHFNVTQAFLVLICIVKLYYFPISFTIITVLETAIMQELREQNRSVP